MKKSVTLTTPVTTALMSRDRSEGLPFFFVRVFDAAGALIYTLLGFSLLTAIWYVTSTVTEGGLPTPLATFQVFWELVKDPFYDYGPNDKGIGLQLASSLGRVFSGFLLGAVLAIPVGLLMGASAFSRRIFYPIVQILRPVSRSEERRV